MLLRLLIVLTMLGPSGPRVCTCASAKASPAARTTPPASDPPVGKHCPCCHRVAESPVPATDAAWHEATSPDHTAPVGHEQRCPAAQPRPVAYALAPASASNDTPTDSA